MPLLLVPEIGLALVAIVGVMMLFAYEPFRRWLVGVLSRLPLLGIRIPFVGTSLINIIEGALTAAWNDIHAWIAAASSPFASFLDALWKPVYALVEQSIYVFESVYGAMDRLFTGVIPNVMAWVQSLITRVYDDMHALVASASSAIISWAESQIVTIDHYIEAGLAWTEATITATARDIISWATGQLSSLYQELTGIISSTAATIDHYVEAGLSWTTTELSTIESWAVASITSVVNWTTSELSAIESWASASITALWDAIWSTMASMVTTALAPVWGTLRGTTDTIVKEVSTEFPDVAGQLRTLTSSVPTDIAGAISALSAVGLATATFTERCGIPLCDNLSTFGKDLKLLETLIGGGALLAFIEEIAAHPREAATVIKDTVGPIANDAATVFKATVGV